MTEKEITALAGQKWGHIGNCYLRRYHPPNKPPYYSLGYTPHGGGRWQAMGRGETPLAAAIDAELIGPDTLCVQCGERPQLPESAYPNPLKNVYRCQHCLDNYDPTEGELRQYNSSIYSPIYPNG
jgi:hypothetical protein